MEEVVKMRNKSNTSALIFERELPGEGAYHFPIGESHESPCMDPYFRSIEYLAKKEQWMKDAGILGNNCTEE